MSIVSSMHCDLSLEKEFTEENIVYCSVDEAVARVVSLSACGSGGRVNFINPYSVMLTTRDSEFRDIVLESELNLADGIGVQVGAFIRGLKPKGRSPGPDVLTALLRTEVGRSARHFVLGGSKDQPYSLTEVIRSQFNLESVREWIPGTFPFGSEEIDDIAGSIREYCADYVWVCLGTRKQELLGSELFRRVPSSVYLHVGAAIDFLSARKKRAPYTVRRVGLEWAYRLVREPRRLAFRNLDSPKYLLRAMRMGFTRSERLDRAL